MLHHTLGDGRCVLLDCHNLWRLTGDLSYDAYYRAAQQVVISSTSLNSKETAAAEIDRVLTECLVTVRPLGLFRVA